MIQHKDLFFSQLRPTSKVPTKRLEDGGYDVYADFEEEMITIPPHSVVKIPTGIASAFHESKVIILKERGTTGTKNMTQKAGVIDSGFRGEWFVPVGNDNPATVVISKLDEEATVKRFAKSETPIIYFPYEKAIAQALVIEVPRMIVQVVPPEHLQLFVSERTMGELGSSGK